MKLKLSLVIPTSLAALLGLALFIGPKITHKLIERELTALKRDGVNITWSGLDTSLTSARLASASWWIPGPSIRGGPALPVSLDFADVAVALSAASLASLAPSLEYSTSLYGGVLQGDTTINSDSATISAKIQQVKLSQHPLLKLIGFADGEIEGQLNGIKINQRGPSAGTFRLQLRRLYLPYHPLARMFLQMDSFGSFDLDVTGAISPSQISASDIKFSSMFGTASGSALIKDHLTQRPSINLEFHLSLSDTGSQIFGPWLPLIPEANLESATRNLLIKITSISCLKRNESPQILQLGADCLEVLVRGDDSL